MLLVSTVDSTGMFLSLRPTGGQLNASSFACTYCFFVIRLPTRPGPRCHAALQKLFVFISSMASSIGQRKWPLLAILRFAIDLHAQLTHFYSLLH